VQPISTAPATAQAAPVSDAPATGVPGEGAQIDTRPFPRDFNVNGTALKIHQPQYESWSGDQLGGRFVLAVSTGSHVDKSGKKQDTFDYGIVQFNARTQIDKEARAVVLTDLKFESASFPTATDKQAAYLAMVRGLLKPGKTLTVSLALLESSVEIEGLDKDIANQTVDNHPPEILFRQAPAVLVLVDGEPALKPAGSAGVERVINTRSLILRKGGRYYLYMASHWMSAASLAGPWSAADRVDPALTDVMRKAVEAGKVDTLQNPPDELQQAFAAGKIPDVSVRTHPAELITTEGEPAFVEVPGTRLSYIDNTGADVFIDAGDSYTWYVLVSGRWFSAASSKGPWKYVDASRLPADFVNIPEDSPKGGVLASIPNTPEAKESLIANSIPQTATVERDSVELEVPYDGDPRFKPIEGTPLQFAWNTPVAVIRVSANSFYAVNKGVWFTAPSATGPWIVADSVPAVIYTIPSTSALHYVTYVRVYGSNGNEVYVGYTPGYYGTIVNNNVVIYGTGYGCDAWIGTDWYGCPATYGMGAYFGWNVWVGWSFGWGWGWYGGWYGGYNPWWGPWWGPSYPWGWGGGGAAAWNVYGHWGNAAVRGTAAAWANPWTGNAGRAARGGYRNEVTGGRGVGRAAVNTNVYTGTTSAAAGGIRYNPQTGRVVAGRGAAAVNPYTGQAAAAGSRSVVNTNTGRVTNSAGAAAKGQAGAAGAGGFNSDGSRVDAKGAGGFHYNADTGEMHSGGAVKINDNVYAGRDGNVYRYGENGQWETVTRPEQKNRSNRPSTLPSYTQDLNRDRAARERADRRMNSGYSVPAQRPSMNRPHPSGGFRSGFGGRSPAGGGFRRH